MEFYDNEDELEEPSFTLYDFKKWLNNHKDFPEPLSEQIENENKEASKEKFKKTIRERVKKKVNKKLSDRKKE